MGKVKRGLHKSKTVKSTNILFWVIVLCILAVVWIVAYKTPRQAQEVDYEWCMNSMAYYTNCLMALRDAKMTDMIRVTEQCIDAVSIKYNLDIEKIWSETCSPLMFSKFSERDIPYPANKKLDNYHKCTQANIYLDLCVADDYSLEKAEKCAQSMGMKYNIPFLNITDFESRFLNVCSPLMYSLMESPHVKLPENAFQRQ